MKQKAAVIGTILSAIFFILFLATPVPSKHLEYYGDNRIEKYVGGDAYNYEIEAGLRGGEIAGAKSQRALYLCCSALLLVLSLYMYGTAAENNPCTAVCNHLNSLHDKVSTLADKVGGIESKTEQMQNQISVLVEKTGCIADKMDSPKAAPFKTSDTSPDPAE